MMTVGKIVSRNTTRQAVTFGIVGSIGFVVDSTLLYIAVFGFGLDLLSGRAVSYVGAVTATWYLNRRFTFASQSLEIFREWARFAYTNLLGAFVNLGSYFLLVSNFLLVSRFPIIGVACGSLLGMTVNFVVSRKFVFRDQAN